MKTVCSSLIQKMCMDYLSPITGQPPKKSISFFCRVFPVAHSKRSQDGECDTVTSIAPQLFCWVTCMLSRAADKRDCTSVQLGPQPPACGFPPSSPQPCPPLLWTTFTHPNDRAWLSKGYVLSIWSILKFYLYILPICSIIIFLPRTVLGYCRTHGFWAPSRIDFARFLC